ncbi:DUF1997 domain-containing protein [Spirulina sp. CCNP1310]|uniref:DUF1997 domain-containing protein n=1 Tax=Spirulina sp. CCNP1310 TaxID=3110249 RepID=UPI002B220D1D|nr:DUF1997 domain-containing protein [Spirulina sp. CCNP1310]MEA5418190.1 DUF1997 domain-containing protein [Spirulina sp. CCNP1310]
MKIRCAASEPVTLHVEEELIPIHHYLRQPQRLVNAIANPKLMEVLGGDRYRLKLNPLNLLNLYHFQPTVILEVKADSYGMISIRSLGCEIRGIDYINDRFSLELKGRLIPAKRKGQTYLEGRADVVVTVDVPPALLLAPLPMLETAGVGLVQGILSRIKDRILSHLLADYHHWAHQETTGSNPLWLNGAENPAG